MCVCGLIGFLSTIIISSIHAVNIGKPFGYYSNFSINVFFESIFIFIFFKEKVKNLAIDNIVIILSKYSFGIYLVHALIIEKLSSLLNLNTLAFNAAISVPAISIIVFVISSAVTHILFKIPIIKKYAV